MGLLALQNREWPLLGLIAIAAARMPKDEIAHPLTD